MKNLKLILLFTFFCCAKSFAQEAIRRVTAIENSIQADTVNLSPNKEFENRIKLKPINESLNDIEIRFYEKDELSNTINLKILELKDSIWLGTLYGESNYPTIRVTNFELIALSGFENVLRMLLQKNLTSLPGQHELKPKMKNYRIVNGKKAEQVYYITDGQSYTVEFKIGNRYRIYTFVNPDIYSKLYDDVQELKDYVAIVNIFNTELKTK
jgi:hypothetical protein